MSSTTVIGGYELVPVVSLLNLLSALEEQMIGYRAFRVFFAALSQLATRNAACRTAKKQGRRAPVPMFRLEELYQCVGGDPAHIRADLRSLEAIGLLTFTGEAITINAQILSCGENRIAEGVGKGRSKNRLVPLPRRLMRYLSRCSKPSVAKVMLAYLIRGLTRLRDGTINTKGAVKATWLAHIAGVSIRAARAARALLMSWGFITGDDSSNQHQLNRNGARFEINPHCVPDHDTRELVRSERMKEFAGPPASNLKEFAPLNKEHRTLSDKENQKRGSGVQRQGKNPPQLKHIDVLDLRDVGRLLELHRQATKAGWIDSSESSRAFFVAAAVRARQAQACDPVRVFVVLVRRNLRSHISQAQEDEALRLLRDHLQAAPKRRVLSLVSQLVQACSIPTRRRVPQERWKDSLSAFG